MRELIPEPLSSNRVSLYLNMERFLAIFGKKLATWSVLCGAKCTEIKSYLNQWNIGMIAKSSLEPIRTSNGPNQVEMTDNSALVPRMGPSVRRGAGTTMGPKWVCCWATHTTPISRCYRSHNQKGAQGPRKSPTKPRHSAHNHTALTSPFVMLMPK